MKPCRTRYKKAINPYKYGRVARSPLSKHCKVRVACYDSILEGWLMGEYLFVALPEDQKVSFWERLSTDLGKGRLSNLHSIIVESDYFRYYVGDNIRTDHVMYYETGLECKF
jgi:hypothetical protein